MAVISSRTRGYKGGVILLLFATAVYVTGFGSPYWSTVNIEDTSGALHSIKVTYYEGMWMLCIQTDGSFYSAVRCFTYGGLDLPAWFHVVRVLECLCILLLAFACIYAFATNCRPVPVPRTRYMEISAAQAGLLGFIGCVVYEGLRNKVRPSNAGGLTSASQYISIFYALHDWTIDWAFYMADIGSGLCVIAAIIIAITNKPLEVVASPGGMVLAIVGVNAQTGYTPQPIVAQWGYTAPQPCFPPAKAGYPAGY